MDFEEIDVHVQRPDIKSITNTQHLYRPYDKACITRKYFQLWLAKTRREQQDVDRIQKLVDRINIKKKNTMIPTNKRNTSKTTYLSKAPVSKICCSRLTRSPKRQVSQKPVPQSNKYRYQAQQEIIIMQKKKLIEQEQVIEELKFGKVGSELESAIAECEKQLKEMKKKVCTKTKVKCGVPTEKAPDEIKLLSEQAPHILRELEYKAKERELKREEIKLRRQKILERRKRENELAIERKNALDDEERRKAIEEIERRRLLELEKQKLRLIKKQEYIENCKKADSFYKHRLKRKYFGLLKKLLLVVEEDTWKAKEFYNSILLLNTFRAWRNYTHIIVESREQKAREMYRRTALIKAFQGLKILMNISHDNEQVAVDFYNMRLMERAWSTFQLGVCIEKMRMNNLISKADNHYKKKLVFKCFYQWKTLPSVNKLEKAKEESKRKWREKVWQIIPDYKPREADY